VKKKSHNIFLLLNTKKRFESICHWKGRFDAKNNRNINSTKSMHFENNPFRITILLNQLALMLLWTNKCQRSGKT
jgi:hypothetical protein